MRILIVGSGGREHALSWRARLEGHEVWCAPASDGIAAVAQRVPIDARDIPALVEFCRGSAIELVVIGPEQPLVDGLADALRSAGIAAFGASRAAAELEGSKANAKDFMARWNIPTARYHVVRNAEEASRAFRTFEQPPVVKADGLAAGKGVVVPEDWQAAEQALRGCLEAGRFGAAGQTVVLEERLPGEEASFFVLSDGQRYATLAAAQDHKRLRDGDEGPNTGGMGAYAPAPVVDELVRAKVLSQIVEPTLAGLAEEGRPYVGVLFVGLMIDAQGDPKVIEYNCRFGDPEAQALLFGLTDPIFPLLGSAARGQLEAVTLRGRPAASIVLAAPGYPVAPQSGAPIEGIDAAEAFPDVAVFHAGTRRDGDRWLTHGGRVLTVCGRGDTLEEALERGYRAAGAIHFEGQQWRRDIGARAVKQPRPSS